METKNWRSPRVLLPRASSQDGSPEGHGVDGESTEVDDIAVSSPCAARPDPTQIKDV